MPIQFKDKELYSVNELERILPITPLIIRQYLREKKITGHKIGKAWYVSKENVEAFLGGGKGKVSL